ncbi:MAG: sensory rhodopsin transducer [Candidatus Borkfalkiaceae bacterium]|nr:sensory rhodopsin transducer [Christensenellaceae bacterium]
MAVGKKEWIVPDCELPREGEGELKGHESVIVVNDGERKAEIRVRLYFTDKEPYEGILWEVEPQRVRCFRMNDVKDMCGYVVPLETQYAMKLESSEPIVVQYGRLDNRQTNLAYYTTMAY